MRILVLITALLLFAGCSGKGINVYFPVSYSDVKNIVVKDLRKSDPQIVGYVLSKEGKEPITVSEPLDRVFEFEISREEKSSNVFLEVRIERFEVLFDANRFSGENAQAFFKAEVRIRNVQGSFIKYVRFEESKWINPLNYEKGLEQFVKKALTESIRAVLEALEEGV